MPWSRSSGKDIGWPLLRDQGNSAYMRDTGDPKTTEGGMIEWGYYEETEPRLCHPRDILQQVNNSCDFAGTDKVVTKENIDSAIENCLAIQINR